MTMTPKQPATASGKVRRVTQRDTTDRAAVRYANQASGCWLDNVAAFHAGADYMHRLAKRAAEGEGS